MQRDATRAHLRFIVTHILIGWIVSLLIAAFLLASDAGNLRTLMLASSAPELAIICFLLGSVTTFTGLVFATGIVLSAQGPGND